MSRSASPTYTQSGGSTFRALEPLRFFAERCRVIIEEGVAQLHEFGILVADAECHAQHAACAMRRVRTEHIECHGWQRTIGANTVEGIGEIARGVRERAVKIEKYCANAEPRRGSEPIRHV